MRVWCSGKNRALAGVAVINIWPFPSVLREKTAYLSDPSGTVLDTICLPHTLTCRQDLWSF
ncbi:MAG: hypothetical protein IPQ03_13195, partial [Bacteroidetes bacterium]|nr:hypothetical protein [Bacteroidota bacterium]